MAKVVEAALVAPATPGADASVFLDVLALPPSIALSIFSQLPADTRLRCSEVCCGWRALVSSEPPVAWLSLDVSTASGSAVFNEGMFRAAVAKAGGQLKALDVTGRSAEALPAHALRAAVFGNLVTLTELRGCRTEDSGDISGFEAAARCVRLLADVVTRKSEARLVLITDKYDYSLFEVGWSKKCGSGSLNGLTQFANIKYSCYDVAVDSLSLTHFPLDTARSAGLLADAAERMRLPSLSLLQCKATTASLPALTRLVTSGWLRKLVIFNSGMALFKDGDAATKAFCDAVRASKLTHLVINNAGRAPAVAEAQSFVDVRRRGAG